MVNYFEQRHQAEENTQKKGNLRFTELLFHERLSVMECLVNFPVNWVEQNLACRSSGVNVASNQRVGAFIGARRSPSAKFHLSWPVSGLVNIRIWPSHAIDAHSGFVRFLTSLRT